MFERSVPAALAAALSCACGKSAPRVDPASVVSPTPTPSRPTLAIAIQGRGAGSVRVYDFSRSRITDCSGSCVVDVAAGSVYVMPIPAPGSKFIGWSGDCSALLDCAFSQPGSASVIASFDPFPPAPWHYDWVDVTKLDGVDTAAAALDDEGAIAG